MAFLLNAVRGLVSGANNNKRFVDGDFNLDLAYITRNIIAMGFPSSGLESVYRNDIHAVARFLNERHDAHYLIFNLSDRSYDRSCFRGRVVDFGFPDKHSPPLSLLLSIVKAMHEWLSANEQNVAAVHCLAGRGRTGTAIACYLVSIGMFDDGFSAADFFTSRRSESGSSAFLTGQATVPSQLRYINYFADVFKNRIKINIATPTPIILQRLIFNGIPRFNNEKNGCRPFFHIFQGEQLIFESELGDKCVPVFSRDLSYCLQINRVVAGDLLFHAYHQRPNARVLMFRFAIHTEFVLEHLSCRLRREELDECDASRFPPEFFMDLVFCPTELSTEHSSGAPPGSPLSVRDHSQTAAFFSASAQQAALHAISTICPDSSSSSSSSTSTTNSPLHHTPSSTATPPTTTPTTTTSPENGDDDVRQREWTTSSSASSSVFPSAAASASRPGAVRLSPFVPGESNPGGGGD